MTDWSLHLLNEGIISEATIRNIDIGARKSYFNIRNFICLIIATISTLIIAKKHKIEFSYKDLPSSTTNNWLVLSLALFIVLSHWGTGGSFHPDMFEKANPAISIDRIKNMQIPIIQYLSSHMLSEQITPIIYSLLHPNSGSLEWLSWDFIIPVINGIIYFLLLSKWLNNQLFAFIFLLFYPFAIWVIPKEYIIGFIPLLLIKSNIDRKRIIAISIVLITGFLWKLDTGIAALTSTIVSIIILNYWTNQKIKPWLIAAITSFAIGILLFGCIYLIYPEILDNFYLSIDYFTADQAHGRVVLTDWNKDFKFRFHYFIFPIISTAIFGLVLLKKKQDYLSISLVFSIIFYLTNFQRGAVRHSFTSGSDVYTSSVMYLILGLVALILIQKFNTNKIIQFLMFLIVTASSILFFKPGKYLHKTSLFNQTYNNLVDGNLQHTIHPLWVKERDAYLAQNITTFKSYLDKHLKKDETFIDLSNHPMLYYFTNRKNPSYFNQFLQNTVTSRQQIITVEKLKKEKIPIVLYSYYPQEWLDRTDNVPNSLRYHIVHAYIKANFKPIGMINNKILWLHNSKNEIEFKEGLSIIPCLDTEEYFGILPKLLAKHKSIPSSNSIDQHSSGFNYNHQSSSFDSMHHESIMLEGEFEEKTYLINIETGDCTNPIKFKAFKNQHRYIIPIDWLPKYPSRIRLEDSNLNTCEFTTMTVKF
jgi:hypothetical protein